MIQKGSAEYTRAQAISNRLASIASTSRWNNNSYYKLVVDDFGKILDAVAGLEGFAGEVAKTVAKTIGGPSVARCSSKQAWIIACAIVENNMHFDRLS